MTNHSYQLYNIYIEENWYEKLQQKCKDILGEETDLEALIKEFDAAWRKNNKSGGNNSNEPSGGGGGSDSTTESTEVPTTPPLPDNTQDQMKYYNELSVSQLNEISKNLQAFAKSNNLTVEQLLTDEKNIDVLIKYLTTSSSSNLPQELIGLIKDGDTKATQQLLYNIFTGNNDSVMGINTTTKSAIATRLNKIAAENNLSTSDLLKVENAELIRKGLVGYNDIANNLNISGDNIQEQLLKIYDGDGVDNYSSDSLNTLRDYMDSVASSKQLDIDTYLASTEAQSDIASYGKLSVLLNTSQGYGDEQLISTLVNILKNKE